MKILLCILQQCLWLLNILTVLVCTEWWLYRYLHKHVFRSLQFRKDISYETDLFFSKCSKLNLDLTNAVKNWKEMFSFSDNFIWIGCRKFSLLPGKYFSSGDHVLRNGLTIWYNTKKDSLQLKVSQSDDQRWSNYCRVDFSSVWEPLNSWLS